MNRFIITDYLLLTAGAPCASPLLFRYEFMARIAAQDLGRDRAEPGMLSPVLRSDRKMELGKRII